MKMKHFLLSAFFCLTSGFIIYTEKDCFLGQILLFKLKKKVIINVVINNESSNSGQFSF